MSGLITEPLGNAALSGGSDRNLPGDAYPASVWDSQDWFGASSQLARGIGNAAATYGTVDDFGRPLSAPEEPIPAADANARYGIPDQLHFTNDVPESVASSMYEAKRAELMRAAQARASDAGLLARFGAGLVSGAVDPLNDLAGVMPGIGEARIAGMLAKTGLESGLAATMATRALSGATTGVAAQAPLVAMRYGLSRQEQADYSASDAMADIIMGGALGGGLHTAIGGLGDLIGRAFGRGSVAALAEDSPAAREALARTATAQTLNGDPVNVAPVLDTTELRSAYSDRLAARGDTAAGNYAAYTPQGTRVELTPEVIEADKLIASNDGTGAVNPDYPPELQPRDRSSAASQAQVTELASRLEPERLGPSSEVSTGAPIVGSDNAVESGNGRVMALRRVYSDPALADQAAAYRAYLEARGHDTSDMQAPILIGRRVTEMAPEQRQAFTKAANERATLGMSAAEQARADATRAGNAAGDFQPAGLTSSANRNYVARFMAQVPAEERGGMLLTGGQLSTAGETRIKAAQMAHAYGDSLGPVLEKMLNGDTEHMKAVAGALTDAAGMWSKLRAAVAAGEVPAGLDITPAIGEAVQLLDRARSTGTPIGALLSQADMLGGPSPAATALLHLMFRDEAMRQPVARAKLTELLNRYVDQALEAKPGPNLLGTPETSPADIMRAIGRGEARNEAAASGLETAPQELNPDRPARADEPARAEPTQSSTGHADLDAWHIGDPLPEDVARAEARAAELAKAPTDQLPQAEREPIRREAEAAVLQRRIAEAGGAIARERKAVVIMGPPAAGKSSIADPLAKHLRALVLDSDDIKAQLPEYENGLGAARVHTESKLITDRMVTRATDAGLNIILTIVGSSGRRLAEVIGPLKEAGYHVTLVHNDLPIETAARRSMERFRETGRLIPINYLLGLEGKLDSAYTEGRSLADEHAKYSNDVPRGRAPTLQEQSSVDPLHEAGIGSDSGDQGPGGTGRGGDRTAEAEAGRGGSESGGLTSPQADDARSAPAGTIPPELSEQIDSLQRDFAAAGDQLAPEAQAELARITEADEAQQSVLGAITQAASCLIGGLA